MAEEIKVFKGIKGSFTLEGSAGKMTFEIEGAKPPTQLKDLGQYIGTLVQKAITGVTPDEVEDVKAQNKHLQAKIDELLAQRREQKSSSK